MKQRIEDVLTTLYDYDYIDIEKFYNDKSNNVMLQILDRVLYNKEPNNIEAEILQDLYNELDSFIKFESL